MKTLFLVLISLLSGASLAQSVSRDSTRLAALFLDTTWQSYEQQIPLSFAELASQTARHLHFLVN
jgi:hypothetical protein